MQKESFFRNHVDTMAIMALNLAIAAVLISLWVSNTARIDAVNRRSDQLYQALHDETKDFHGRLCAIEERNKK